MKINNKSNKIHIKKINIILKQKMKIIPIKKNLKI